MPRTAQRTQPRTVASVEPAPHDALAALRIRLAEEHGFRTRILASIAGRLEAARLAGGQRRDRLIAEVEALLREAGHA